MGVYQLLKSGVVAALRLANQERIFDTAYALHCHSPMHLWFEPRVGGNATAGPTVLKVQSFWIAKTPILPGGEGENVLPRIRQIQARQSVPGWKEENTLKVLA